MPPFFSVIMPVRDGGAVFELCLEALTAAGFPDRELIVVDDGSLDGSRTAAARAGATVLRTAGGLGPGAARNLGAEAARGEFLFFLDADCEPLADTFDRAAATLRADPGLTALFGSYDDAPPVPGLVARFKNLQHHWVHQQGAGEAATFWSGCGAFRRRDFLALGGFAAERYPRPSVEDIELGYRLRAAGGRITLDPEVQVRHHKAWTLTGVVRSDLLDRGIPWMELNLARGRLGGELNLGAIERSSTVASCLLVSAAVAAPLVPAAGWVVAFLALALLFLNRRFYRFLARSQGPAFLLAAVPLHWLHYLNCAVAAVTGLVRHLLRSGARAARG